MFRPISQLEDIVVYFASILRPQTYLELGCFKGGRISKVAPFVNLAVGVDARDVRTSELKENWKFYQMTTDEFFKNVVTGLSQFDMVFIDAGHSHKQSYKDFLNVVPYVRKNGLVFMHDTYPMTKEDTNLGVCGEVYKTAAKIQQDPAYEIVTIPVRPGMSIIRKLTNLILEDK